MKPAIEYLQAVCVDIHLAPVQSNNTTTYIANGAKVEFGANSIEISHWKDAEDEELLGYWVRFSRTSFNNVPFDHYWPYFFHINMVVDLNQFLNAVGDANTLPTKRAIYLLKEAIRKTA